MPKKILIVEDERPMARALELKLTNAGYLVQKSSNGKEALKLAKAKKFDLILLDIMMPEMDGFSFLQEVKKNKIKAILIVLSNLSQESDADRAKKLGVKEFFIKSNTSIAAIVKEVQKYIK